MKRHLSTNMKGQKDRVEEIDRQKWGTPRCKDAMLKH